MPFDLTCSRVSGSSWATCGSSLEIGSGSSGSSSMGSGSGSGGSSSSGISGSGAGGGGGNWRSWRTSFATRSGNSISCSMGRIGIATIPSSRMTATEAASELPSERRKRRSSSSPRVHGMTWA
ncbi:MAG: hypothetical protein GTN98_13540 [Woeseiaceae bacterium]|nr:hypothetical protein [Woeseiaceae bacterium]